jgi:hypothetical protein
MTLKEVSLSFVKLLKTGMHWQMHSWVRLFGCHKNVDSDFIFLGHLYMRGIHVKQDMDKAIDYLQQASDLGIS